MSQVQYNNEFQNFVQFVINKKTNATLCTSGFHGMNLGGSGIDWILALLLENFTLSMISAKIGSVSLQLLNYNKSLSHYISFIISNKRYIGRIPTIRAIDEILTVLFIHLSYL